MPDVSEQIRLRIPSDPANLASVRQAVEKLCADAGFQTRACEEIGLFVNEAMANVIRHAYGGATDKWIDFTAHVSGDAVKIAIRDWGNGVNPEQVPPKPRDPMRPGGLGLICLRQMMDHVHYQPQEDGMLLEMTRNKNHHA
jgi:serine/threonine-protein kinase RsbW